MIFIKLFEHIRHEDMIVKHNINKLEIDFLVNLQKELNTQTNDGNAQPIYWGIMDYKRYYTDNGIPILCNAAEQITLESNKEITDYIKDELNIYVHEYNNYKITVIDTLKSDETDKDIINQHLKNNDDEILFGMNDCLEFLKEYESDWELRYYEDIEYIVPNLVFLTRQSAEDYLKAKAYHHSDDAHTYAMTALYNPIVERLWEILREVDFSKIESED